MNTDLLIATARQRAMVFPGAELDYPFGPETEVYRVGGKMFALVSSEMSSARSIVTLKADPTDVEFLCSSYEEIIPGYHMNKRHWITLSVDQMLRPKITVSLVEELVTESYLAVVGSLPRAMRPLGFDHYQR